MIMLYLIIQCNVRVFYGGSDNGIEIVGFCLIDGVVDIYVDDTHGIAKIM